MYAWLINSNALVIYISIINYLPNIHKMIFSQLIINKFLFGEYLGLLAREQIKDGFRFQPTLI